MKSNFCLPAFALAAAFASACSPAAPPEAASLPAPVAQAPAPASAPAAAPSLVAEGSPAASPLPRLVVHKSPTCGCCSAWIKHVEKAGYPVEVVNGEDLNPLKLAIGVPAGKGSCHTAIVEGYFIEGHVPVEDVARLLAERPDARGLTVPGMPVGSPGMEVPSGEVQPYTVYLVNRDGSSTPFSQHGR
ncbi:MAG: DUF411 domain-containing protein [Arenimonas sp.]|uniref:DUF411 domain-containing protein n=1 Tax=Arenimonas sp. TaxID=1872635 RepID=UPI0025C04BD6|nr:DUF411 domain-containing protein [Arenimonas sp.]MBW8368362.1 DUF411 domain-containing protein [Arenimonas sp.]